MKSGKQIHEPGTKYPEYVYTYPKYAGVNYLLRLFEEYEDDYTKSRK